MKTNKEISNAGIDNKKAHNSENCNIKKDNGKIYIVATPIGNLEDITFRAIKVLKEVDLIAAEDTRHTLQLLNHFEISKPLISYYKENEKTRANELIQKVKEGKNIAVVSDAGTPGISDPGEVIIKEAIKENIEVVPIPGACAFVNALIVSGLDTSKFQFIGFLPVNQKEKEEILEEIRYNKNTLIFYEAPHKLEKTIESMLKLLGNRKVVLAKELTKVHENFSRDTLENTLAQLKSKLENEEKIRGEYVIILEGSDTTKKEQEKESLVNLSLEEHYKHYEKQGLNKKEIIKKIAKDRNVSKNEIYKEFV